MLFRLKHDVDPFELNPGAKAIKEFAGLTDKQFFFVCLVADVDHDNPLHTLPEKQRREKAASVSGYGMEGKRPDKNARNAINKKVESIEVAIVEYRKLQFDEDKSILEALNHQITEVREFAAMDKMKATKNNVKEAMALAKDAQKLSENLVGLLTERKKIQGIIKAKEPSNLGIRTNTAADITEKESEELEEDGDESKSLIDVVMAKE